MFSVAECIPKPVKKTVKSKRSLENESFTVTEGLIWRFGDEDEGLRLTIPCSDGFYY